MILSYGYIVLDSWHRNCTMISGGELKLSSAISFQPVSSTTEDSSKKCAVSWFFVLNLATFVRRRDAQKPALLWETEYVARFQSEPAVFHFFRSFEPEPRTSRHPTSLKESRLFGFLLSVRAVGICASLVANQLHAPWHCHWGARKLRKARSWP